MPKTPLAQAFTCEFWEISKNTFCYRTPLVTASKHLTVPLTVLEKFQLAVTAKAVQCSIKSIFTFC